MILVTGSLAFDFILDFPGKFADNIMPDKIHSLNISFLVRDMRKSLGGTAGNIAYSLSLLGIKAAILGIVGEDFSEYKDFLEKCGISTAFIKTVNTLYSSMAFGITDSGSNHIWGFYQGADALSDNLSINDVEGEIDFGIIAPHNPKSMLRFASEYKKKKLPFLFDPGMQLPWFEGNQLKEAFSGAKIIIGNDYEISVMEKKTGISDINTLSNNDKIIITTMGEHGSKICHNGKSINISPVNVDPIDPAGAGDAYRAGFMAGYLRGFSLKTCGQMGSLSAAYTVEKPGTTTHNFTYDQFINKYYENFKEKITL